MSYAEGSENFSFHVVAISNREGREENIVSEIKSLKEALDEKNREISKLNEEVKTILEEREELDYLLKAKDKQIDSLKEQVNSLKYENEDLNERLISLETESTELTKKNEHLEEKINELNDNLNSKNAEIDKLKKEKRELNSRVKSLETKMKKLTTDNDKTKKDNKELKERCARWNGKNMELEDKVTVLNDKIKDMKKEFKEKHDNLKTKFEDHLRATQSVSHEESRRAIEMQKQNDALVLGELCWRVQSMIYKEVLPSSEYDERESYRIGSMKENLELLENEEQFNQANQAWKQVQEKLKWNEHKVKRLARSMGMIQGQRNVAAHPELNKAMLTQSAQRMNDEGKLRRWCSFADVKELIFAWNKLNEI